MNTRAKIMGLAALPLAGLLATGSVAMAQSARTPAGTQVIQQTAVHRAGDLCPDHPATTQQGRLQLRDRDRNGSCVRQHAQTATRTTVQLRLHDGSCDQHADR